MERKGSVKGCLYNGIVGFVCTGKDRRNLCFRGRERESLRLTFFRGLMIGQRSRLKNGISLFPCLGFV